MKRILIIAFFLISVINNSVIFAGDNETVKDSVFNDDKDLTTKTFGKKKVSRPSSKYGGYVVTRSELEKSGETNLLRAIALKVPGVKYTQDNLMIRGISTLNSKTSPLYIIDGVETSYVSHLLVTEVEYVEVLKDSSTSMFGMKGANGVIIINRIK